MITLTVDAAHVLKKWSTWLAILSASCAAGLTAYGQLPLDIQSTFPHWMLSAMSVGAVLSAMMIPVATSIQQRNIPVAALEAIAPTPEEPS